MFEPHVTLTSDVIIPPGIVVNKQTQTWLDDVSLPKKINLDVRFDSLDMGAKYYQKLMLSVDKGPLEDLGPTSILLPWRMEIKLRKKLSEGSLDTACYFDVW